MGYKVYIFFLLRKMLKKKIINGEVRKMFRITKKEVCEKKKWFSSLPKKVMEKTLFLFLESWEAYAKIWIKICCSWPSICLRAIPGMASISSNTKYMDSVTVLTVNVPRNRIHLIRVFRHVGASDQAITNLLFKNSKHILCIISNDLNVFFVVFVSDLSESYFSRIF